MGTNRAILVDECLGLAKEGKEYIEIRKHLENKHLEKDEISVIMRLISNDLEKAAIAKGRSGYAREVRLVGLFLLLGGIFLTAGTYLGLINTGNSFIIAYGPVIGGLAMILSGQYWNRRD